MFPKTKSAGFTLPELVMTIVILAILAAVAMPSFVPMLRNSEIRNAAESVVNGMQRARAEAVARNASMQFVLGADTSWTVDYVTGSSGTPLDSRSGTDGSKNVTITVLPASSTTLTFNNIGQVVANADASATVTQVDLQAAGGTRNMRVTISAGGKAKMCDPGLTTGSSARAC